MGGSLKKKWLVVVAALIIVGAAVLWMLFLHKDDGFEYAFSWPRGNVYVYAISYTTDNTTNINLSPGDPEASAQAFHGAVKLEGELRLKSYGEHKGVYLLGVTLDNITAVDLQVMGSSMYKTVDEARDALTKQEGFVEITPRGEVTKLSFDNGSSETFKNLVQNLIGEVQVVVAGVGGASAWETTEKNQYGETPSRYSVTRDGRSSVELEKKRSAYRSLHAVPGDLTPGESDVEAVYEAGMSRDGHVERFEGEESITVKEGGDTVIFQVKTEVTLALSRIEVFRPESGSPYSRFANLKSRTLGELVVSDAAEQRSLEQRAAGLTPEQVVEDLLKFGKSGDMPMHSQWVWRATGALRLDPKSCWKLKEVFEDPTANQTARNTVVELLVSVGHGEAQAVLRNLLESPAAMASPKYWDTFQRLMLLTEPTAETVRFVHTKMVATAETKDDTHFASSIALGGLAKTMRKNGQEEEAKAYNDEIAKLLQGAETDVEKVAYLSSLGNSADKDNVELVATLSKDENATVRSAVVDALRDTQTEKSEEVVLELATDQVAAVQKDALRVLAGYTNDEEHLTKIRDMVDQGTIQSQSYGALMDVLTQNSRHGGENNQNLTKETLELLLQKDIGAQMRLRIRNMLGR